MKTQNMKIKDKNMNCANIGFMKRYHETWKGYKKTMVQDCILNWCPID